MFQYFKDLIDKDNSARVSAFLALLAGACLCVGFLGIVFQKNRVAELGIISAGLVTLATFAKDSKNEKLPPDKEP